MTFDGFIVELLSSILCQRLRTHHNFDFIDQIWILVTLEWTKRYTQLIQSNRRETHILPTLNFPLRYTWTKRTGRFLHRLKRQTFKRPVWHFTKVCRLPPPRILKTIESTIDTLLLTCHRVIRRLCGHRQMVPAPIISKMLDPIFDDHNELTTRSNKCGIQPFICNVRILITII